jgi:hypothetical protein
MFDSQVLAWILFMLVMSPQAKAAPEYISPGTPYPGRPQSIRLRQKPFLTAARFSSMSGTMLIGRQDAYLEPSIWN